MEILSTSIHELAEAIKTKKISAVEVTQFFLDRIQKLDPQLNSYITVNENALQEAQAIDKKIQQGEDAGVMAGIPWGIKDLLCTQGIKTTAGSKMLSQFIPPYDATTVVQMKKAGVIILGKLNQDEFAMGSSNETSFYGLVKNPWNLDYVPGGSSGGSAAALAAGLTMAAVGTDTGGSIRQPASFCGVVGVKPTYGRISRYGIVAYASSLDQAGPMNKSVADAALSLDVMCGYDEKDSTSYPDQPTQFFKNLSADIKGKRIGYIKEHLDHLEDEDTKRVTLEAFDHLKKLGAELKEISISLTEYSVPIYYIVSASEASSNLSRYDGVRYGYRSNHEKRIQSSLDDFYSVNRGEGFGREVKKRIMLGTYALSAGYSDDFYLKACKVRRLLQNQFFEAFKTCDALVGPVTTTPAFKIAEKSLDPLRMYLNDIFTTAVNLSGLPAMSLPYGISKLGLPIGVQITANQFCEQQMLNIAYALEKTEPSLNFKKLKPVVI